MGLQRAISYIDGDPTFQANSKGFENMRREKSPGLKILWIWTLGTAAVLVTTVVRTRIRDMEQLMKSEQQQHQQQTTPTDSLVSDTELITEDKS